MTTERLTSAGYVTRTTQMYPDCITSGCQALPKKCTYIWVLLNQNVSQSTVRLKYLTRVLKKKCQATLAWSDTSQ